MTRNEFITKLKEYIKTFVPRVRPACAHFVSRAYKEVGSFAIPEINYVPNIVGMNIGNGTSKWEKAYPGDIVIFDGTYDAVDPHGVGLEDNMTHIGIVVKDNGKSDMEFIHFSWSQDKPIEVNFKDMPSQWSVNSFRSMDKYFDEEEKVTPAVSGLLCKVVDSDGNTFKVDSITMELKFNGKVMKLFAHKP